MINLNKYIKNNELCIDKINWKKLNDKYDEEALRYAISNSIEETKLPLPLKQISEDMAFQSYIDLQELSAIDIINVGNTYTKYPYISPPGKTYLNISKVGLDASNFFHQLNRFMCDSITSPSPFRVWTIEKFRLPFLKSLWSLKFDQINNSVFRQCLKMRKYIAPQFRPSVAKAIYELYNSRRILDFSAGWGDRLCAFHACKNTEFYFGVDPNRNVVSLYESQNELYNTNKKTFFVNEAFEDIDIPKKEFDTVFTSPPYFNLERYTTEENQSWVRYKKLDTWLNHFLFVSIEKSWRALKKKGYFIINISDVYSGHKINNICNPMLQRMKALDGAKLKDCIGIQMNVRPNSNIERKGTILVESIWIWQKS